MVIAKRDRSYLLSLVNNKEKKGIKHLCLVRLSLCCCCATQIFKTQGTDSEKERMNDLDMDSSNSSLLFYQAKGHPLIHDFMRYLRSVLDNMLLIKNTNNVKPMLE